MAGLYEGDRLAAALREARDRTLALYAHLEGPQWEFPRLEIVNPPHWELAHIAWFQEFWCLRHRPDDPAGRRVKPLLEAADALFDSRSVPHDDRWTLPYPPRGAMLAYMEESLEATLAALAASDERERYFFRLALLHEDMHGEALLMTLQTLALPAPGLEAAKPPASVPEAPREVVFDGGEFLQGTLPEAPGFAFDNEIGAHVVSVRPFAMATQPVSQGDFVAFVEEGGYRRESLWTPEGWAWRAAAGAHAPRYWRREGGTWLVRRYDAWHAIDLSAPMVHVSCHEAEAYCRWAERRLPTETEWEFAARNAGRDDRYPWGDTPAEAAEPLDYRYTGPASSLPDPAPSRTGLRQMLGGVWEWTATPFAPYPGFRPGPYGEYSEPWFHTHRVLRGGRFATRSRLVHNRWRNFYRPERGDVFAGLRTCALEA